MVLPVGVKKLVSIFPVLLGGVFAVFFLGCGCLYLAGFRWYQIPTASMEPTIPQGGHVVGGLSEKYREHIERFHIAIYLSEQPPYSVYAKRVIGLSGERVTVAEGSIAVDGKNLNLPAAIDKRGLGIKTCDLVVPVDAVFVLGDNAGRSADSRFFGPIPKRNVIGRVYFKD